MDAETLLSKIETLHKEYLDAKYEAESAITVAKKFGLPTRESDRLVAMAEIERDKDYPSAIGMLGEAAEVTRGSLDKFSPEITIVIKPVELKHEQRGMISFDVTNRGKALAKDLKMEFHGGNIEVESVPDIPGLKAGETRSISVPVLPKQAGEIEVTIAIAAKRVFDGKSFDFTAKTPIKVVPREPTARTARATEMTTCSSCNGKVKPGFDIAVCLKCNSTEHLACAKRTKKCGNCGATLEF
jgi:CARDB